MGRTTKTKKRKVRKTTTRKTTKAKTRKTVKVPTAITLGYKDAPSVTLVAGHVNAKIFKAAFKKEGWKTADIKRSELKHEHWRELKRAWRRSSAADKKAQPVTTMYW